MPLTPGQSLSFYEVLGPIGAGGMGEVYRAKDTRLEREVAIKVLPEELADDNERLQRFEREAKTLASLNHPNVAGIHGVDQEGDIYFLALELVPGEDLAERLKGGPLPIGEAIDVCRQIAEGLEAAHEAGVVHRDLKPANVRITPEGVVKILDFGLAKPIRPKTSHSSGATTAESDSFLMTEEGLVLGTPTYMSPEQARGKPIDRRTDLWAFGCVLFECLAGRRAFTGDSFTDVLASIAGEEPDWSLLPPLSARVDELLRRSLLKDPRVRLRDAGEARVQLELASREAPEEPQAGAGTSDPSRARGRQPALIGAAALLLGVVLGRWALPPGAEPAGAGGSSRNLTFELATVVTGPATSDYALSPDGESVAWIDRLGLHVRHLEELEARTLVDHSSSTAQAIDAVHSLAWSPDGRDVAYHTAEEVWRVDAREGTPVLVAKEGALARQPNSLVWMPDDSLVVAGPSSGELLTVRASGGTLETYVSEPLAETMHFDGLATWPSGDLLVVRHRTGAARPDTLSLHSGGELTDLVTLTEWAIGSVDVSADSIWIVRDADGDKSLWRVGYDAAAKALVGEPELVRDGIAAMSMGDQGTSLLVFDDGSAEAELVWVDHQGVVEPFGRTFPGDFVMVSLSHDGQQVIASHIESKSTVWAYDLQRELMVPLVEFDEPTATLAGTLPDGRLVGTKFGSLETRAYPLGGRGESERICAGAVMDLSPDGKFAVVFDNPMTGAPKMQALELGSGNELTDIRDSVSLTTGSPRISHDARWVTYATNRTGQNNVALTSFPSGEGEWLISVDGGGTSWFEADDEVIYYQRGGFRIGATLEVWRVSFEAEPAVRLGAPELLFALDEDIELFEYHVPTKRFIGCRQRSSPERRIVIETSAR